MQRFLGKFTFKAAMKQFDRFISNRMAQRTAFVLGADSAIAEIRDRPSGLNTAAKWVKENRPTIEKWEKEMDSMSPEEKIGLFID